MNKSNDDTVVSEPESSDDELLFLGEGGYSGDDFNTTNYIQESWDETKTSFDEVYSE